MNAFIQNLREVPGLSSFATMDREQRMEGFRAREFSRRAGLQPGADTAPIRRSGYFGEARPWTEVFESIGIATIAGTDKSAEITTGGTRPWAQIMAEL